VPALESAGIRVAWTTRLGGASAEPFASLNLSFVSGDEADTVRANRARALSAVGAAPEGWTSGKQVHGAAVARVGAAERGSGAFDPGTTIAGTDALWTGEPGAALAVLVADCVPILLADPQRRRIAVVHAGWRGLVAGVIGNAAREMGGAPLAFVGPAIGPCCFEVGEDVAGPARDALGARVVRDGARKPHVDLWAGARAALRAAGVRDVMSCDLCTRCEPHRFYSHRAGDTGRQGLLAVIEAR
jgi:YfiH family protein